MKTIKTFITGLLLSAVCLLPISVRAAELQPFLIQKFAGINTLAAVAEKIATMAGVANDESFQYTISTAKSIKGVDHNGIFGVAAAADKDGDLVPILLLPITDLMSVDVPEFSEFFDMFRSFITPKGAGRFEINTPMGTYIAVKQQNCLVVVPEDAADQIPADAKKLFDDLDKYTVGTKLDFEKVEWDTLEENVFGMLLLPMAMADPAAAEQFESVIGIYQELYKEFALISGGIAFNPQTADVEISGTMVPHKGSAIEKSYAGYKAQPTIFNGFRGTPENTVISMGESASMPPFDNKAMLDLSTTYWETILEGMLEQIELEDESGELTDLVKKGIESVQKISEAEAKRGAGDYALSFNTDGTLMFAIETVSLGEVQKLVTMIIEFVSKKMPEEGRSILGKNLKRDYVTVEGFKVSSVNIPIIETIESIAGPAPSNDVDSIRDVALGVYWAIKEGNKQAIAVAVGLDPAKAEQAFRSALEKTKTPAPAQKPIGVVSVQGIGKFLQQTVYPIAVKAGDAKDMAEFKKVVDILASAGNDAVVSLDVNVKSGSVEAGYHISGKAIQALILAVKIVVEEAGGLGPGSRDF